MKLLISDILEKFEKAPDKELKIEALRSGGKPMANVLKAMFDPNIQFVFKEPIEYIKQDTPDGLGHVIIEREMERLYIFVENHPSVSPNLTLKKKKELFTQTLEAMSDKEAEIYMSMVLKKSPVEGLTLEMANEAFPGLIPT